jgi:hypothetical protein
MSVCGYKQICVEFGRERGCLAIGVSGPYPDNVIPQFGLI